MILPQASNPLLSNPNWLYNQMLKAVLVWLFLSQVYLAWYGYTIGEFTMAMDFSILACFSILTFSFALLFNLYWFFRWFGVAVMSIQLIVWAIHFNPFDPVTFHWMISFVVLCFFLMPVTISLLYFIFMATLLSYTLYNTLQSTEQNHLWIEYTLVFILIGASAWCFRLLMHLKLQALTSRALIDLPSGAYNKAYLDQQLFEEVSRFQYTNSPVSMIAMSIDDMAQIEDSHGVQTSQRIYSSFNDYVRSAIRIGDELFHLGEGVFILLMPNSPADGAAVLKERLDNGVESYPWPIVEEISMKIIASTLEKGESANGFYQRTLNSLNKLRATDLRIAAFTG